MKILFSCDEYPPIKSGGIGTVTKIIAEELARRGHIVHVVSGMLPTYDLPKIEIINGVIIHRFKYFKNLKFLFRKARIGKETICLKVFKRTSLLAKIARQEFYRTHSIIKKLIINENIDVVEFPDYLKLSDYYKTKEKLPFPLYDIPVVARIHGCQSFAEFYRDGKANEIDMFNDTSFFNSVNKIAAVSRFSANFVHEILKVKRNIDVIYNPLDIKALLAITEKLSRRNLQDKNIVFLGKIVETKGAYKLIDAFNLFTKSHPDYKLIMIGGGDINSGKMRLSSESEDKVVFTGYLPRKEVCQYIKNATFCVVPSYFENFSMVALEIMALGKALVYTKEASGSEVIDNGVDGLLVNPRDVNEIAMSMELLANDEPLRKKIGLNAKRKIELNYTVDEIVDELECYYKNIIESYE